MRKIFLPFVLMILLCLVSCGGEGGVRVTNTMEQYALDYIKANNILTPNERIEAYYDYTILLDATEGVILTNTRLIYYNSNYVQDFYLDNITEINSYEKTIEGLFIEVYSGEEMMLIEIAALNGGDTFLRLLKRKTNY
tara:strand:+ start:173 stop:586 length:414 start_codon:yes stop_codon:yes gene_type:complete